MKEQKLCNGGFILVEATVGVALFFLLMVGVLHAVGFIAERMRNAAQRYRELSSIITYDKDVVEELAHVSLPYAHSSIIWYTQRVHGGKHVALVHCTQQGKKK